MSLAFVTSGMDPILRGPHDPGGVGALSNPVLSNARLDRIYARLTPVYDLAFGPILQPGRVAAIRSMALQPGDRVLEVGVGTGLTASLYPRDCQVVGIDLSAAMLEKAQARLTREDLHHVRLVEMDAARLTFADGTFDVVWAPYTISVVPDPVRVAREMRRVCRPGGRIVFLNHFRSRDPLLARIEDAATPAATRLGFNARIDLDALLDAAGLRAAASVRVNVPRIWSLVTCLRP